MRVYCVCRAKGKEVTWRIKMFGASLICREFKSWSAKPKLLSELLQEALNESGKIGEKTEEEIHLLPLLIVLLDQVMCVCV